MKMIIRTNGKFKKTETSTIPNFLFAVFYNLGEADVYTNYNSIEKKDRPVFYGFKKIELLCNRRFWKWR